MTMDASDAEFVTGIAREVLNGVHAEIRTLVSGLDREALSWKPHPEANSIAVLVVHALGSEREMLAAVRGVRIPRDRLSEFRVEGADAGELAALLDQADAWLDEQVAGMTAADLTEQRPRGERPPEPGLFWLVTNYAHAREHLGQMLLTRQLYEARPSR